MYTIYTIYNINTIYTMHVIYTIYTLYTTYTVCPTSEYSIDSQTPRATDPEALRFNHTRKVVLLLMYHFIKHVQCGRVQRRTKGQFTD